MAEEEKDNELQAESIPEPRARNGMVRNAAMNLGILAAVALLGEGNDHVEAVANSGGGGGGGGQPPLKRPKREKVCVCLIAIKATRLYGSHLTLWFSPLSLFSGGKAAD